MTEIYPFLFEAEVVHHDVGSECYRYTVIFVPDEVRQDLPLKEFNKLRITGEVDDLPFEAALTPVRGQHYILLSKKTLAAIEKGFGDTVTVRFQIADQDAVDIPERLAEALDRDAAICTLWRSQTAGKRRALAYVVASAKKPETQDKRIEKVFAVLRGEIDLKGNPLS